MKELNFKILVYVVEWTHFYFISNIYQPIS